MKKRWLLLGAAVVLCCVFLLLPTQARAEDTVSGQWGSITWQMNTQTGALVCSGTGELWNEPGAWPLWSEYWPLIKSVQIGEGITYVGWYAFNSCTELTQVSLPSTLEGIGPYAFSGCTSLTEITIPDGVKQIRFYAFEKCTALTKVDLPESATAVEEGAFIGCSSLKSLSLPNIQEIPARMVEGCTALEKLTLPKTVTSIGDFAFAYCEKLTQNQLPEHYTQLGVSVFRGCAAVTKMRLPDGFTQLPDGTFLGCTALTELALPDTLQGIGADAIYGCSALKTLKLPDSVTQIGSGAFSGCTGLTELIIPNGVTVIAEKTFSGCTGLTEIAIPDGVTDIEAQTFSGCTGLTQITLPAGVKRIGEEAFRGCSGLTVLNIPKDLEEISLSAVKNCPNLVFRADKSCKNFSVDEYGVLFNKEKTLLLRAPLAIAGEYRVPQGVTAVGEEAFQECDNLETIYFPEGLTEIGARAFFSCANLHEYHIPASLKTVGSEAFNCYSSYATHYIYIEDLAAWCRISFADATANPACVGAMIYYKGEAIRHLVIPDGVESIGPHTFYWYSWLTAVTFPESLKSIAANAFSEVNMRTGYGWTSCTPRLEQVFYRGTEEQWKKISIGEGNDPLLSVPRSYGVKDCPHTFGPWTSMDKNSHQRSCHLCGAQETELHQKVTSQEGKQTCVSGAQIHTTCENCDFRETEILDPTGEHLYTSVCDEDCGTCGELRQVEHTPSKTYCMDEKSHWILCEYCLKVLEQEDHIPGPEATEEQPQRCTVCEFVLQPTLEHTHVNDGWSYDDSHHWRACAKCPETWDREGHSYENQCSEKCSVCGAVRKDAHVPGPEATHEKGQHCQDCGKELAPPIPTEPPTTAPPATTEPPATETPTQPPATDAPTEPSATVPPTELPPGTAPMPTEPNGTEPGANPGTSPATTPATVPVSGEPGPGEGTPGGLTLRISLGALAAAAVILVVLLAVRRKRR